LLGSFSSLFTGLYTNITGQYLAAWSGLTIMSTPETIQTLKLWVRTA
jgi:glycogen debranching enzyme